ncbi:MAG: hypothetical protein CBC13_07575 [Planctomycetia bacterium TMED53]|nr:MAG: hypothetical protein CBC13_07575 [Planctomycetia bacterium TMED53]
MDKYSRKTTSGFVSGLRFSLLCLCSLLPLGCGFSSYFLGDDSTVEAPQGSAAQAAASKRADKPVSRKAASEPLDLQALERMLCERHPSILALRQELSAASEGGEESWIPGARFRDSDSGYNSDDDSIERELSLDWSPSSLNKEASEERLRRSRIKQLSLQLEEAQNRLLFQLREDWSGYWYQCQQQREVSNWLTRLEIILESDSELLSSNLQPTIENWIEEWNLQLKQISETRDQIQSLINNLVGRSYGAALANPLDPGDGRFEGVESLRRTRRHPAEMLLSINAQMKNEEVDFLNPGTWNGLVIGAQTRQEKGQALSGSNQGSDAGDWVLTVGVEIPLGAVGLDSNRAHRMTSAGSLELESARVRQQIERQVEECRKQISLSEDQINRYLRSGQTSDLERVFQSLAKARNGVDLQLHWQEAESLLEEKLSYQQALADRAVHRFQLMELLALPSAPASRPAPLTKSFPRR